MDGLEEAEQHLPPLWTELRVPSQPDPYPGDYADGDAYSERNDNANLHPYCDADTLAFTIGISRALASTSGQQILVREL